MRKSMSGGFWTVSTLYCLVFRVFVGGCAEHPERIASNRPLQRCSVAITGGGMNGQSSGWNTSGVQLDVTAGGLVSLRHMLLRGAASNRTQRDLDRGGRRTFEMTM